MKKALLMALLTLPVIASAHDIWIESSANLVRTGDLLRLSLMLGNHGNEHRDFKLASKIAAGDQNLFVFGPKGDKLDLTSTLFDNGYGPQDGFWSTTFQPEQPGMYMALSTFDKVMSYAPVRDIKSAKTFFVVSNSLDAVPEANPGFDRVVGAPLELVPIVNPVTPFGSGNILKVKLLYKGKPLPNSVISFVPRGATLKGEMDMAYEKKTDANGIAQLTLKEANSYLISAHQGDDKASGEGYKSIGYSATLCMIVPGLCPCCVKVK